MPNTTITTDITVANTGRFILTEDKLICFYLITLYLPHPALSKGEGSKDFSFQILSKGEDLGEVYSI